MVTQNISITENSTQQKRKPIGSAEVVTFIRAMGAIDKKVKNPDYLAKHFLGFKFRLQLLIPTRIGKRKMELKLPGGYWYFQARTKHIDASLKKAIQAGVEQFVILGAGYDSRPYRFRDSLANINVFEVDMASTQDRKKKQIVKLYGTLPEHIHYIPIDFNSQSIKEILIATEYDTNKKTFFIWEGVSYYLPEKSVDTVLNFIKNHSAPGSFIVFDYALKAILEGDYTFYGAQKLVETWERVGEPGLFGFKDEDTARNHLNDIGFDVIADMGPQEMERTYISEVNGNPQGRVWGFMHLLDAIVRN